MTYKCTVYTIIQDGVTNLKKNQYLIFASYTSKSRQNIHISQLLCQTLSSLTFEYVSKLVTKRVAIKTDSLQKYGMPFSNYKIRMQVTVWYSQEHSLGTTSRLSQKYSMYFRTVYYVCRLVFTLKTCRERLRGGQKYC